MKSFLSRSLPRFLPLLLGVGVGSTMIAALPAMAQAPAGSALPTVGQPTGGTVTQITVTGGNRSLFKIALPPILGGQDVSNTVVETETRDFTLSSLFQVL